MQRLLATAIFAYAGLAAAQWASASRCLNAPPGRLICGNVASDPYRSLVNGICPPAAACAIGLTYRCIKARRWPAYAITALITFTFTSACLVYEVRVLDDHGIDVGGIWWLPPWLTNLRMPAW